MKIQDWQVTMGKRTWDIRLAKHVVVAVLLVAIAVIVTKIFRNFPALQETNVYDVIGVLAILFAVIQFIDSRIQKREMNRIARTMSTRFIGLFPKNLVEIAEVIGKANQYVYIMADFVDYGHYSSPIAFGEYLNKIKQARDQKVMVRIICYDKQLADMETEEQFPDKDFKEECESRRFKKYFEIHSGVGKPCNAVQFRNLLGSRQAKFVEDLSEQGVEFAYFPERSDFFLWLEDDEEAIFAFKNIGNKQREFSFRTQDSTLIEQFRQIFDRRWQNSHRVYDKTMLQSPPTVLVKATVAPQPPA